MVASEVPSNPIKMEEKSEQKRRVNDREGGGYRSLGRAMRATEICGPMLRDPVLSSTDHIS